MSISNTLRNYYSEIEKDKSKIREIIAFCLFCIGTITLAFFHEPWFDEFQAWGISKDSLYNILFVIPHYEGHPPLWHLILKCFTHFNINPELCLKIPNLAIMFGAIWLLIFKSPFPRLVRITLPFTYFLFYQYSIVNRPYSIFVLAMFLCATFFETRNTNPFRFIGSLALMCLSSAYGVLFAVGITVAWGLELVDFKNFKQSISEFFKTKQFKAIFILFIFCLMLAIMVFPAPTNASMHFLRYTLKYLKFLYSFFGIMADATIFNIVNPNNDLYFQTYKIVDILYILSGLSFGAYLTIFIMQIFKKIYKLNYFLIPYFIFSGFCFFIYYWPHHIGIIFVFLIFLFWANINAFKEKLPEKEQKILLFLAILTILMQLSWSLCAYVNDYKYDYAHSREMASYLKKYQLYKYKIFAQWREFPIYKDKKGILYFDEEELIPNVEYEEIWQINPEHQGGPVLVLPYFNKNIFQNFNVDFPDKLYLPHHYRTPEEQAEIKHKWREKGLPDLLIGKARLEGVWQGYDTKHNYFPIKTFYSHFVWKNRAPVGTISIFAHKNVYDDMPQDGKITPKGRQF